jgi:hypothetical protein
VVASSSGGATLFIYLILFIFMAFKFNKGSQVIGDLISADDPQRNTKIDFGDDQINFVVSGTIVASITSNQFSASYFAGDGSSLTNISGGGVGGSGDITSVTAGTNLTGGGTSGAVTLNLAESISLTTITASNWVGLPASISSDFFGGQFGDSSDGDLTVVGTYTAAKELHFNNLTIPTGTAFKPNGHKIFVSNTLTIGSGASLNDDGNNATNQAAGLGLASRNYLIANSSQGGNGVALTATGFSNGANANANSNSSPNNSGQSPTGGKGGNVTLRANTGGNGGVATVLPQKWNGAWQTGRYSANGFNGGTGGGGGAINITAYTSGIFSSGGGGSGGGAVWISAKSIVNQGRISANGGRGADGILATGTAECAGGGGGGGGNTCVITKTALASLGTIQAGGGVGGTSAFNTGTGVGINGTTGNAGSLCIIVLS